MEIMSLDQLKAENAKEESEKPQEVESVTEAEEVEESEAGETESEESEAPDGEDEETGKEELEDWMKTDTETESSAVPVKKHIQIRQKLKEKVRDRDDEIADLKAEIESLKTGSLTQSQPVTQSTDKLPARPKRSDFYDADDPDEAYDQAIDDWYDKKLDHKLNSKNQEASAESQKKLQQTQIETGVKEHYERVEALINDGKVSDENYIKADRNVRNMLGQLFPGQGDDYADLIISNMNSLGEGSEKVWFQLGRNGEALNTLRDKLTIDPNGIQAMLYLGKLQAKATSPSKRVSSAPKPQSSIQGDSSGVGESKAVHKKYKDAVKAGDYNKAINLKIDAKDKGVDTSSW